MIHNNTLSVEHLRETARRLRIRDIQLLSRMVHALYLVEQLAVAGLPFIFKGGTCLSLLLNSIDRLSIDVDIEVSLDVSPEAIGSALAVICQPGNVFTRYERQQRQSDREGSQHYRLACT